MGEFKLKFNDGNLRWIGGGAVGARAQEGDNPEVYQLGSGLALAGLIPKQLGFVYAAPNFTQAQGERQVGLLWGGGVDLLLTTVSAGLNPGINLGNGDFSLGAEIMIGPLIGLNKDWALVPAFKMTWPDLLSNDGRGSVFYGFQLAFVYGHLPDE